MDKNGVAASAAAKYSSGDQVDYGFGGQPFCLTVRFETLLIEPRLHNPQL